MEDYQVSVVTRAIDAIYDVAHIVADDDRAHAAALAARSALLAAASAAGIPAPGVGDADAHIAQAESLLRSARPRRAPRGRR